MPPFMSVVDCVVDAVVAVELSADVVVVLVVEARDSSSETLGWNILVAKLRVGGLKG